MLDTALGFSFHSLTSISMTLPGTVKRHMWHVALMLEGPSDQVAGV